MAKPPQMTDDAYREWMNLVLTQERRPYDMVLDALGATSREAFETKSTYPLLTWNGIARRTGLNREAVRLVMDQMQEAGEAVTVSGARGDLWMLTHI